MGMMMRGTGLATVDRVKRYLLGDPARNGYERVQSAMRVLSRRIAEAEFHRTMASFYSERVMETDPNTHWWEFAEAKQKQHDHQMDCLCEEKRVAEARALVDARTGQFKKAMVGASS